MRRLLVTLAAAAIALLAVTAGAAAAPARDSIGARAAHHLPRPAAGPQLGVAAADRVGTPRFVPLAVALGGTATITGYVYDYGGLPVASAPTEWWTWDATNGWQTDSVLTGADGSFTLQNVPGAAGTGEVWAYAPDDTWSLARYNETWADGATTSFTLRPGKLPVTLYRWGGWKDWGEADVYIWTSPGGAPMGRAWTEKSAPYVAGNDTWTGDALAMPGAGENAVVRFWYEEGVEVPYTGAVAAGETSATGLVASEADAQRTLVWAPYWASGKPGTTARLWFNHFPGGRVTEISGYSAYPATAPLISYLDHTSTGAEDEFVARKVSSTAKPGYYYIFGLQRADGHLYLETAFQVCTLNASRTAIRHGGSVRLSGVIPTQGHQGSVSGKSKRVIVWKRTSAAGQPQRAGGGTTLKGWTRVGSFRADGLGRYHTGYLHPTRSTWYIVWYPGDDWYWGAFTSVRKVAVR